MEQRREPRFVADQPISVTVMGQCDARYVGIVKNASGRGLGLELPVCVPPGTALKIELDNSMILGEAVFCRPQNGAYFVGVELREALRGLSELAEIVKGFSEEERESPVRKP
jgi:hypothetical protein